jgi:Holliday junction resolvasome RuvABC endonuclease subunit
VRVLAGDIATVGALCGEDAAGHRVTVHFDLRALSVSRTGRKKGHISGDHGVLMRSLHDLVEQAIEQFRPDVFAYEENTARGVGSRLLFKLQGVVEMICAERSVKFDLFYASQARKFALGDGGLDKLQAADAVAVRLGIDTSGMTSDEIDAVIIHEAGRVRARYRLTDPDRLLTDAQLATKKRKAKARLADLKRAA